MIQLGQQNEQEARQEESGAEQEASPFSILESAETSQWGFSSRYKK